MRLSRPFLSITATLLLLLTACGGTTGETNVEPTDVPIIEVAGDENAVKVGVLAIRSAVAANAQYGPIVEYLQEELDQSFELVPLGQEELFEQAENGEIDFFMANPLSSVQVQRLYDAEFLATLSRNGTGAEFGGLIVVRPDSDIEELEDLRGRSVTCVAFETAAAGCNFQVLHLLEAGISTDEFGEFTETPSQDNIVLAVLNGAVDAGFIRSGQLERMVRDGTIGSVGELRILDPFDDDYIHPHTTALYPEWPIAALADTDPALVSSVRDALLGIEEGHEALTNANAAGFVAPEDYGPLSDLVVTLKLRTWDADAD